MNVKGYNRIPNELSYWITFYTNVLPLRLIRVFYRTTDWSHANTHRLCYRCLFDAGYA